MKELSSIVLEMLASLNSVSKSKDRLIEIAADGVISDDEIDDFIYIQNELERISITQLKPYSYGQKRCLQQAKSMPSNIMRNRINSLGLLIRNGFAVQVLTRIMRKKVCRLRLNEVSRQ